MDKSLLHAQETFELEVVYPNGESSGMIITLQSLDTKACKRVIKKWDKISTRAGRKGLTFEQKEQASIELLSEATVGWTGYENEGEEVLCDEEEKALLYSEPVTSFVRSQVDEALGDVSNFLSLGAKT